MCERKEKKDAPAAVVSPAACVSRAPPADASRPALSGWDRPACSLRVNFLLTMFCFFWDAQEGNIQRLVPGLTPVYILGNETIHQVIWRVQRLNAHEQDLLQRVK